MPKPTTPLYAARRRWTEEDARAALAAFAQSGLSMRAFTTSKGIKFERLARWRRKTMSTSGSAATKRVSFVEVRPREIERERVEVVLRSGRVLRCAEEIASTPLRRLVSILEEEPTC
jgi:transposase-like protein